MISLRRPRNDPQTSVTYKLVIAKVEFTLFVMDVPRGSSAISQRRREPIALRRERERIDVTRNSRWIVAERLSEQWLEYVIQQFAGANIPELYVSKEVGRRQQLARLS